MQVLTENWCTKENWCTNKRTLMLPNARQSSSGAATHLVRRQVSEMTITTRDGLLTIDGESVFPIFGGTQPSPQYGINVRADVPGIGCRAWARGHA